MQDNAKFDFKLFNALKQKVLDVVCSAAIVNA